MTEPVKKIPLRTQHKAADVIASVRGASSQATREEAQTLLKRLLADLVAGGDVEQVELIRAFLKAQRKAARK